VPQSFDSPAETDGPRLGERNGEGDADSDIIGLDLVMYGSIPSNRSFVWSAQRCVLLSTLMDFLYPHDQPLVWKTERAADGLSWIRGNE
jgi:hypothetical protein